MVEDALGQLAVAAVQPGHPPVHIGHQHPSACTRHADHLGKGGLRIREVLKHALGVGGIEASIGIGDRLGVAKHVAHRQALGVLGVFGVQNVLWVGDHRLGAVYPHHPTGGTYRAGHHQGARAGTAADIECVLARCRSSQAKTCSLTARNWSRLDMLCRPRRYVSGVTS